MTFKLIKKSIRNKNKTPNIQELRNSPYTYYMHYVILSIVI
jgi:hypothetical protein